MEQLQSAMGMLDLMIRPAFCVKDGIIVGVNHEAKKLLIETETPVRDLLRTGEDEYLEFTEGCLYLSLQISSQPYSASVTKVNGLDIFVLEQDADQAELNAMALAAQELREPLSSVMTVADRLFPVAGSEPAMQDQIARINRGLFQMLRVISNMSDAVRYTLESMPNAEIRDVTAILQEIFQRAAELIALTDIRVSFQNYPESIYTVVDEEKLERAVYNILSNAVKFTPKGGTISAKLTRRGKKLYLTVQDSGCGIHTNIRGNIHTRYLRQPGLEDSRFGIGLGMVLIRSAAEAHGGTILMEHPENSGVRITMTMEIRQTGSNFRSHILHVDYAGERDHGLIEFSENLPVSAYRKDAIN